MNDALFDMGDDKPPESAHLPAPVREEQISKIRDLFDRASDLDAMGDRQIFVESTVLRQVSSLRALSALEARRVIDRLENLALRKSRGGGSAWDEREHDTWIDKL